MIRKLGPRCAKARSRTLADALQRRNFLDARTESFGDALHVQVRMIEIQADELRGLDRRPHGVAPEVLEQPVFVIHKADKDGWDGDASPRSRAHGSRTDFRHRRRSIPRAFRSPDRCRPRAASPSPSPPPRGEKCTLRKPSRTAMSCTMASSEDPSVMTCADRSSCRNTPKMSASLGRLPDGEYCASRAARSAARSRATGLRPERGSDGIQGGFDVAEHGEVARIVEAELPRRPARFGSPEAHSALRKGRHK